MPRQTSLQVTPATERQVADLKRLGYGTFTDIVRVAIDRMHQTEQWQLPPSNPMPNHPSWSGQRAEWYKGFSIQVREPQPGYYEPIAESDLVEFEDLTREAASVSAQGELQGWYPYTRVYHVTHGEQVSTHFVI